MAVIPGIPTDAEMEAMARTLNAARDEAMAEKKAKPSRTSQKA